MWVANRIRYPVITPEVMLLVSVSVLVFGVLITWLCALLSINKYLKMKASTLYTYNTAFRKAKFQIVNSKSLNSK